MQLANEKSNTMSTIKRFILPGLLFLISFLLQFGTAYFDSLNPELLNGLKKTGELLLVAAIAWTIIAVIRIVKNQFLKRFDMGQADNLRVRKLYTQYNILEKIIIFIIILIATAIALMQFDGLKNVGISLFASAGVAGLIIGLSAQKALGSILAGLQIAITQPIRLDDVVIVENEWGWIEEINLTYVVVRIWDKRRLIVPSTYFLDKPFQNWTRTSAEILGTVFIYTDYTVPFDALRKELTRLLEASPHWDKKVNVLQVTDARENTVEIRALMSAASFSRSVEPQGVRKGTAHGVYSKGISGQPAPHQDRGTESTAGQSPASQSIRAVVCLVGPCSERTTF
jgi:small-conductance mechanosensitive channel